MTIPKIFSCPDLIYQSSAKHRTILISHYGTTDIPVVYESKRKLFSPMRISDFQIPVEILFSLHRTHRTSFPLALLVRVRVQRTGGRPRRVVARGPLQYLESRHRSRLPIAATLRAAAGSAPWCRSPLPRSPSGRSPPHRNCMLSSIKF